MQIVGPKTKLKHIKRVAGEETADGQEITWALPIRFEGVMTLLTGQEIIEYQKVDVIVKYKLLTNYMDILEQDRVQRNSTTYNVELVDDKFFADKILVVLLDVKKEQG